MADSSEEEARARESAVRAEAEVWVQQREAIWETEIAEAKTGQRASQEQLQRAEAALQALEESHRALRVKHQQVLLQLPGGRKQGKQAMLPTALQAGATERHNRDEGEGETTLAPQIGSEGEGVMSAAVQAEMATMIADLVKSGRDAEQQA